MFSIDCFMDYFAFIEYLSSVNFLLLVELMISFP